MRRAQRKLLIVSPAHTFQHTPLAEVNEGGEETSGSSVNGRGLAKITQSSQEFALADVQLVPCQPGRDLLRVVLLQGSP